MAFSTRSLAANNKIALVMVLGVGLISGLLYAFCDFNCQRYSKKKNKTFKDRAIVTASYVGILLNPTGPIFAAILCIGYFLIGNYPFFTALQTSPMFAPLQTSPTMSLVGSLSVEKPDTVFKEKTFLNTIVFDAGLLCFSSFFPYQRFVFLIKVCCNGRSLTIMFASHTVFTFCRLTLSRLYLPPIEKREFSISDISSFLYQVIESSFLGFVGIYGVASICSSAKSLKHNIGEVNYKSSKEKKANTDLLEGIKKLIHNTLNYVSSERKKVNEDLTKEPKEMRNEDLINSLEKKQESEK